LELFFSFFRELQSDGFSGKIEVFLDADIDNATLVVEKGTDCSVELVLVDLGERVVVVLILSAFGLCLTDCLV
jgi:hypothetical protein